MKTLYLVRHAKSSWDDPTLQDIERTLNKRGRRDAPTMGKRLAARGIHPDLVVSSPARRARETATILATELGYPAEKIAIDEGIWEADVTALLAVIGRLDDALDHVLLVGHNPGMTNIASRLHPDCPADLPTCAVVELRLEATSWGESGDADTVLVDVDYPKRVHD